MRRKWRLPGIGHRRHIPEVRISNFVIADTIPNVIRRSMAGGVAGAPKATPGSFMLWFGDLPGDWRPGVSDEPGNERVRRMERS